MSARTNDPIGTDSSTDEMPQGFDTKWDDV